MNFRRVALLASSTVVMFAALGCTTRYVAAPPPPPPVAEMPPLIALADHNGYETGRGDAQRDLERGGPYDPRRTRAYHDTPGYDPHLGPFEPYQNAFRNAYLRGYDHFIKRG